MRRLLPILLRSGCTASTPVHFTDGKPVQLIECGAVVPWSVCYKEANSACPKGYEVLREEAGFNRKSLTVRCK